MLIIQILNREDFIVKKVYQNSILLYTVLMKVTAVLPAYNAEKTLQKTYDAIPKEAVHEIILVDDASTDETVKTANNISDLIVVIHEKNKVWFGGGILEIDFLRA